MAWRPSLHPHYRASIRAIGHRASTVLCRHPTSQSRLHSSPFQLVRAYSFRRDWTSRRTRTTGISLVASLTSCVARSWPSTPGLQAPLARTRNSVLPSAGPTAWADSERNMHFGAQYHSRFGRPAQSIRPHYLSVYASTQLLPATLQHSIPGLRLRATRAGFTPACQ